MSSVVLLVLALLGGVLPNIRPVCVVNRSTKTFDCGLYISNCTLSSDTNGSITLDGQNIKICNINSQIQNGYLNMICPFDLENNILNHTINFTSGNCWPTESFQVRAFKSVKPNPIVGVKLSSESRKIIRIQGSMIDNLIPSMLSREVYIVVEQLITDEDLKTPEPVRNKTKRTQTSQLDISVRKLHAYINYSVTIIWRVKGGMFWSDPVVHKIRTKPYRPTAAPELLKGVYSYNLQDNGIVFYWQKIPKLRENGPGLEYIIYRIRTDNNQLIKVILENISFKKLSRLNISLEETNKDNETTSLLIYQTTFGSSKVSGILRNFLEGDIVMILANNTVGLSNFYSAQRILSTAKVLSQPLALTVELLNGTHSNLTWKLPHLSIDHLHFYWCYGIWWKIEGWVECKERISSKTVTIKSGKSQTSLFSSISSSSSSSYNSHIIDITQEESITCEGCFLHFGMSAESQNISSPILWNTSLSVLHPSEDYTGQTKSGILGTLETSLVVTGCVVAVIIIVIIVTRGKIYITKSYDIMTPKDLQNPLCSNIDDSVESRTFQDSEESYPDSGQGDSVSENDSPIPGYSKFSLQNSTHDKIPDNITKQKCDKNCEGPGSSVQTESSGMSSQNDKRLLDDSCGEYSKAAVQGQSSDIEMTEISLNEQEMPQKSGEKTIRLPFVHYNGNISAPQSDDDDSVPHIEVNTSYEDQYKTISIY
ncbi:uncharacterized protein LOC130010342 [Patella vulgata]|uniref:uncharacterized protein LOC130010342 n=1 Tax=Patella vulgata TaxID=6465 RepID=UPI00217F8704|nr:uncharacterized protein LOC130010342 [Patella vulgata]